MDQQGEKVSYNMMMVSESGWQVRKRTKPAFQSSS
jgi:hypothetical protein